MKIHYVVAASLLISLSASAQKDELKALKKLNAIEAPTAAQATEFNSAFAAFESKIGSATDEQKRDFYYYRGTYFVKVEAKNNPATAEASINKGLEDINKVIELEKAGVKKKYTDELQKQTLPLVKNSVADIGRKFNEEKKYKEAAAAFGLAYKIDPTDAYNLYYAAAMSLNAQDYDKALEYYLELDKIKFTGASTSYLATNKATGTEEGFETKQKRDDAVKQGIVYEKPRDVVQESVRPDIVKNIALIYNEKGQADKAVEYFASARKENPNDVSLIIGQANLMYKAGKKEEFAKLINEAIQKNPNDPMLYYNLGAVSMEVGNSADADKYFKKSLELQPDNFDALVNIGTLQLSGEDKLVKEMNSLGNSAKDNARYEVLQKQRKEMFNRAIPYLEKAHKAKPDDQYVIQTLMGMYQALDKTAEYNAMKAKRKS
jgi:tetratricopeptide (TPR) repeat protein